MNKTNIDFEKINIKALCMKALNDEEARNYLIENFENIMNYGSNIENVDFSALCFNKDIKKVVIENLDLVLPKMKNIWTFLIYFEKQEVLDNIDLFFKYMRDRAEITLFFKELIDRDIYDFQGILNLLSEKIQQIGKLLGIGGINDILNNALTKFKDTKILLEYNNIKKIDEFMDSNFKDIFYNIGTYETFDFKCFKGMKRLKGKIKDEGIDFFIRYPLKYDITIKECEEISNDVFGKFTLEYLTKMKFGQRDPEKALVIKLIMEELLEHSSRDKDKAMESIEEYGKGSFSNVYKVGDYVLKLGPGRREFTIPNHRRILQPIIRTIILGDKVKNKSTNDHVTVVEVQNLVEKSWFEGMEENDVEEILYHIYEELRDDRLIWLDIKPENVGKLLKKNSSNIYCDDFEIIDGTIKIRKKGREIYPHPDAIGMYGEINNPPLEKGNFVILDTDYIFTEEEYDKIKWRVGRLCKYQENLFTKFEKRYKEQKENSTEYKR